MVRPIDRGRFVKRKFFSPRLRIGWASHAALPFEKTLQTGMRATLLITLSNRWPTVESWKLTGKIETQKTPIPNGNSDSSYFYHNESIQYQKEILKPSFVGNANKFDRQNKDSHLFNFLIQLARKCKFILFSIVWQSGYSSPMFSSI